MSPPSPYPPTPTHTTRNTHPPSPEPGRPWANPLSMCSLPRTCRVSRESLHSYRPGSRVCGPHHCRVTKIAPPLHRPNLPHPPPHPTITPGGSCYRKEEHLKTSIRQPGVQKTARDCSLTRNRGCSLLEALAACHPEEYPALKSWWRPTETPERKLDQSNLSR